uniref:S-adenosylmethionine sensor upstream of mTORC1 n=1 Tax=Anopheles epiroticus TaxID=199890 RepID=A0A182PVU5_9DIPT
MATQEQLALSGLIKSVHQRLRESAKQQDPEAVWKEHVRDEELLKSYAEAMHKLATCYWDRTMEVSCKRSNSRIDWVVASCRNYFHGATPLLYLFREKDDKVMQAIDTTFHYDHRPYTVDRIRLLDVGSCYDPFACFPDFSVTAIDIAPACDSVWHCDFLEADVKFLTEPVISGEHHSIEAFPGDYYDAIVFSLLLEYLPSSDQRIRCCRKAYELLKPEGILLIITPDSCHQGANAKLMKNWRYTLGLMGFSRIKIEKLEHVTCMVFRKCIFPAVGKRWCDIHREAYMQPVLNIPQDFNESTKGVEDNEKGGMEVGRTENNDGSSMCLELALEGERLCKSGDCRAGVAFFQAAIQAGTDDLRTLSAIYSQLGNAYFYLGDYTKAMQYHKHDLTLARSMNDRLGEAKSSGNLGNTLKVMGRFDEAAIFCQRHLAIARVLEDRLSEGRALYNLGNVYHAKGKQLGQKDPGDFSAEVQDSLLKAVDFYQQNLRLMRELGDRGAQGRACGNLGNTYYLLGQFETAIEHHQERLRIAREFGDKAAERRANSNLGNSHIFLGHFEQAANHYKRTLSLAIELGERAVEAQACYSLGNTYTLLRDFPTAIDYHQRHLAIAQELGDRIGEARACWSLGNAHTSIGNHEKALHYANSHYLLAKELGDMVGESTARMNMADLRKILGLPDLPSTEGGVGDLGSNSISTKPQSTVDGAESTQQSMHGQQAHVAAKVASLAASKQHRLRRQSMEQLDLIKLTPDGKKLAQHNVQENQTSNAQVPPSQPSKVKKSENSFKSNDEDFFDLLTRSQSKRMDDQRCTLKLTHAESVDSARKPLTQHNSNNAPAGKENRNVLLEMIAHFQSERMDEQRALLPGLKRISLGNANNISRPTNNNDSAPGSTTPEDPVALGTPPDDAFLDMLMRCQGSRIEEQRSELPTPNITLDAEASEGQVVAPVTVASNSGATVPDEDFFSLIMRLQGGRMEDQRATVPLNNNLNRSTSNQQQQQQHNHSNGSNGNGNSQNSAASAMNNNNNNGGNAANSSTVNNGNTHNSSSNSTGGGGNSVGKSLK